MFWQNMVWNRFLGGGCYPNKVNSRVLPNSVTVSKPLTNKVCMKTCQKQGYAFSGIVYAKYCYCGNEKPSEALLVPKEECQMECPGDASEFCGGDWRASVYPTDNYSPWTMIEQFRNYLLKTKYAKYKNILF